MSSANVPIATVEVETDESKETLTLTAGDQPGADLSDGRLDSAMAETSDAVVAYRDVDGGRQEYRARLALSQPQTPEGITIRHTGAPAALVIQAMTLVDQRTGMFSALLPSDRGRYELVHSGDVKVYENLDVQPRAYLVNQWTSVDDSEEALALLQSGTVDFRQHAVVENAPAFSTQRHAEDAPATKIGTIQLIDYAPEEVTLQVNVEGVGNEPALLVLSDVYYPGWQATVDGIDTPIYAANQIFRGLFVPPGEHEVTFVYRPQSWLRGVWISLGGLVMLGLLLVGAWFSAFRNRSGVEV